MKLAAVLSLYTQIERWHTGGGCMALRHPIAGGGYLLITSDDGGEVPDDTDTVVAVGCYSEEGEDLGEVKSVRVEDLMAHLDAAIAGRIP